MDKQERLTKWSEWQIGSHYEWVKGSMVLGNYVLVEVNEKEGYVRMQAVGSPDIVRNYNWQRRYRKRVPSNAELSDSRPL